MSFLNQTNTTVEYSNTYFSDSVDIHYYDLDFSVERSTRDSGVILLMPKEVREMNGLISGCYTITSPVKATEDFTFELKLTFERLDIYTDHKSIRVYIKSKDFKDPETWYVLVNWNINNPEFLLFLEKGLPKNSDNLEMVFEPREGVVRFLDRSSQVYNEFLELSNERTIVSLSRKTSKRIPGNLYLDPIETGDSRKTYYLGETWKLVYDRVTESYKKVPQNSYVRNLKNGELNIGEIFKDRFINIDFTHESYISKDRFRLYSIPQTCSKKRLVDLGSKLETAEMPDIRNYWSDAVKNYMKENKRNLADNKYSDLYYYRDFTKLIGIFTMFSSNSDIADDKLYSTPELKSLVDEVLTQNFYRFLYFYYNQYFKDDLTPDALARNLISHTSRGYFNVEVSYSSNIETFWVCKDKHVIFILEDIIGVNLFDIAKKVSERFLNEINPKIKLDSLKDLCDWSYYFHRKEGSGASIKVPLIPSKSPDIIIEKLGQCSKLMNYSNLINTIQEIFSKAMVTDGSGVSLFTCSHEYVKKAGISKKILTTSISCEITLEDIISHYGGLEKVPPAVEVDLLSAGGSINHICLNYSDK